MALVNVLSMVNWLAYVYSSTFLYRFFILFPIIAIAYIWVIKVTHLSCVFFCSCSCRFCVIRHVLPVKVVLMLAKTIPMLSDDKKLKPSWKWIEQKNLFHVFDLAILGLYSGFYCFVASCHCQSFSSNCQRSTVVFSGLFAFVLCAVARLCEQFGLCNNGRRNVERWKRKKYGEIFKFCIFFF